MFKDGEKVKVDNDLVYLWYKSNKIIETKGGYDGRLLLDLLNVEVCYKNCNLAIRNNKRAKNE
jgi:hypothetical protein